MGPSRINRIAIVETDATAIAVAIIPDAVIVEPGVRWRISVHDRDGQPPPPIAAPSWISRPCPQKEQIGSRFRQG